MEILAFLGIILMWGVVLLVFAVSLMGIYLLISSSFQKYAPPVRSSGKLKNAVLTEVTKYLEKAPKGQQIVDLGSGWGTLLLPLAKKFPEHKFVGIERAFTPFHISRFRACKLPNLEFLKKDFFEYDLTQTNVVLLFLIGFMMPKVTEKCLKELPKGAKVYASRFPLTDVNADEVVKLGDKMSVYYVYEIK